MTITVGRRTQKDAQYIGRPSPLGNRFVMKGECDRNLVCDMYEAWFYKTVEARDPEVMGELRRLYRLARTGNLILGCYCAPRRCHGDTIKAFLLAELARVD